MRAVSSRAGVNIAQAYHYFGSKEALLTVAMRALAREWYDEIAPSVGDVPHPSPVPLGRFSRYWRALAHAMLDEDYQLAELELREDISVARLVKARVAEELDHELDAQERITLAAAFSLSLGWVAFEHFMFKLMDLPDDPETTAAAREQVEEINRELVRRLARPGGSD
jgi:AcrR family transcriptional regulator